MDTTITGYKPVRLPYVLLRVYKTDVVFLMLQDTSNAAVLRKFACSDIERARRLFQADDQFEEPRAVTNYVIVNLKLTNTPTNR